MPVPVSEDFQNLKAAQKVRHFSTLWQFPQAVNSLLGTPSYPSYSPAAQGMIAEVLSKQFLLLAESFEEPGGGWGAFTGAQQAWGVRPSSSEAAV